MKQEELIKFYTDKGFKIIDKGTQIDIKISENNTIMFHKLLLDGLTIKMLEESLK